MIDSMQTNENQTLRCAKLGHYLDLTRVTFKWTLSVSREYTCDTCWCRQCIVISHPVWYNKHCIAIYMIYVCIQLQFLWVMLWLAKIQSKVHKNMTPDQKGQILCRVCRAHILRSLGLIRLVHNSDPYCFACKENECREQSDFR
jgi:hypothetical protein